MSEYDADAREKGYCAYIGYGRDDPCRLAEGWGYPNATSGLCDHHGERGGQEGNSNAEGNDGGDADGTESVTHGVYADVNKLYSKVFDDSMVAVVDAMAADLYERYEDLHGEPGTLHKSRMFEIAMNVAKGIYADNWAEDKPDELKTTSPLVDKETEPVPVGNGETITQVSYSESVPTNTQQKLRREDRQWLKSYGLLEADPENKQAESLSTLAEVLSED